LRVQRYATPGRFVVEVTLPEYVVEVGGDLGLHVSIRPLGLDEFGHKVSGLRLHQGPNPPGGGCRSGLALGLEFTGKLLPVVHILLGQEFVAPQIGVRSTHELCDLGRLADLVFEADELAPLNQPLAV
jgi:hypothetical protein